MTQETFTEQVKELVNTTLQANLNGNSNYPYLSIEDYKQKTGKRFRLTREQKQSGITREQAFQQFMEKIVNKD